jgi:hypothetical protein
MEVWNQLTGEEQKKVKPPASIRLVIEDTTIEAMQEAVKGNPDGVLKLHDELAGFFGSMERYNNRAGNSNRAFYLQAYNGGQYVLDRVGRGPFRFENLSMCVLGGIQPEVMRSIAADSLEDGLIQRIIPVMLRDAEAGKDVPGGPAGARYDKLVARLREAEPPPEPLQFDDAARVIREGLERKHIRLVRYYAGFNKRLAAHIGKYDGLFARLCLLWHYIEGAETLVVKEGTAHRVAQFMHQFMLPHAAEFYTSILGVASALRYRRRYPNIEVLRVLLACAKRKQISLSFYYTILPAPTQCVYASRPRAALSAVRAGWTPGGQSPPRRPFWKSRPKPVQGAGRATYRQSS